MYIGVLSIIVFAIARQVSGSGDLGPAFPQGIKVLYERYTPSGLVEVVDVEGAQSRRHLRIDASIVAAISLDASGNTLAEEMPLLDAVRFISGSSGNRALVLYVPIVVLVNYSLILSQRFTAWRNCHFADQK